MLLNPRSPVPLYRQLADILDAKIKSGEYPPETKIPSENTLAAEFGIGRPTVRQALSELAQQGRLEPRKGSGTFVCEQKQQIDLFSLAGTSAAFAEKKIPIKQRMVNKIRLAPVALDRENPFSESAAYTFSRISLYENKPVLYEEIFLDPALFRGIDEYDFSRNSLAKIVRERFYFEPTDCRQSFQVAPRPPVFAPGDRGPAHLLLVTRTISFPNRKNAIFSRIYCSTDRFSFTQTLGGAS